ncbi:uncharacterized protein TM35_000621190 [Trypanosoma theileri]|uniref:Mucin-associated surface protein (MASP) n=1 Tax=Trypanosoma theileri TaxID=67003 RepID=A0A1X0NG06_9TRYP|nr:uncharacterized protein TM35_000621190 [Trypanosoma theileri]ORC83645.1 hypothetical protein TM35_000621190 [Trypanosoma theileri]
MREMMHRVVCLLVLMLCCAYGCVSADPSKATTPTGRQQNPFQHLDGTGVVGGLGTRLVEPHEARIVVGQNKPQCPDPLAGENKVPCVAAIPGRGNPPESVVRDVAKRANVTEAAKQAKDPGAAAKQVTGTGVGTGYPGDADSHGGALKTERDADPVLKTDEEVVNARSGVSPTGVTDTSKASLLSPDPSLRNRSNAKVENTDPAAAAAPGYPKGVPFPPQQAGVPGAAHLGPQPKDGVSVPTISPVSNTSNGQPKFPGVAPNVTPADPTTPPVLQRTAEYGNPEYPGVHNKLLVGDGGTPTVAINRGPARPPRADVVVSESHEEVSVPTNTHHKENDNQERNAAAPVQRESAASTRNTPTKVTPPTMPTILQPPMPAKSETKPPKKSKADSSSISSVWVRVPLLIVVVFVSATVY